MGGGSVVIAWLGLVSSPVELSWEAPSGCPSRDDVLGQIHRFVPAEYRERAATLRAEGRLVAEGRQFRLELEIGGEDGRMQRTLRGDDCTVLASAAALVVAVMVEPAAVLEEVEAKAAPAEPPGAVAPGADAEGSGARERGGFVAARGLMSWGAAPGLGAAVGLGGGLRLGRWRVGLEALLDVPRRAGLPGDEAARAGARIGMAGAALRGCFAPGTERVEVPLCAGFEAGAMWARGVGLAQPKTAVVAWGAFSLGSGLAFVVHRRVALRIDVEGVVPVRRPRFVVEDRGPVHRPAPVGARAGAAVELRL